jgi:hypothetical protein
LVREPPDVVECQANVLLPDHVVTARVVHRLVLLPVDDLVRMEQMAGRSGMHFTGTFGSRSTKTAGGMHLPAPVSKRKVFTALSHTSVVFSDGRLNAAVEAASLPVAVSDQSTGLADTCRNAFLYC